MGQMCEWNLKKNLTGGIFFKLGHFLKNWGQWGKCVSGI